MSINKIVYLIGYMGSGKTTVGEALAKAMGLKHIDTDEEIKKNEGMSVKKIFMKFGEHQFRNLEYDELKKIKGGTIVSCGGGIVLDDDSRKYLSNGYVIFLDASPEVMYERIKSNTDLPNAFFDMDDEEKRLDAFTKRYEQRKDLYESVSDVIIDTTDKNTEEITDEIIERLKNNENI